ncbi:unnamed protein product [Alternaria alternata]
MAMKAKKKRDTRHRSDAVKQCSSLSSSETQQAAPTSGPKHNPSPLMPPSMPPTPQRQQPDDEDDEDDEDDLYSSPPPDPVPSMQSATILNPKEQSDEYDVEIVESVFPDFEILMQESPSQASTGAPLLMFRHLSPQAFRETFQERTNDKKRAETNNNNNAPGKSTRTMLWKQPKERVCSVCAEMLPWQHFPRFADCEHDPEVCDECFLLWLKQQMESVTNVLCPSSGCSCTITHEDVRKNTPQDVFTRFDELSMRTLLSADKNFLYCHAEGCSSGQIHDTGMESPIFRCVACGHRMCTAHDPIIPFHENETCTQYDERIAGETAQAKEEEEEEERHKSQQVEEARVRREQEAASAAEVAKSSVECPGCGVQIQKTEGCDHMTCRRNDCRFEFCYVCRAPYDGMQGIHRIGNAAHNESCPYHPKKLPTYQGTA